MASSRSFKNYVAVKFEDELFTAIESFVEENKYDIDFRLYRVNNIGEIYLSDSEIEVRYVFVNNLVGTELEFDVIVEQYLEVFDTNHRLDESEHIQEWFHISCSGDIEREFEDFTIHNIEKYYEKEKNKNPLSDSLVPIIYKRDLEQIARIFLEKHYPEALSKPIPIDTKELAYRMGLSVEMREITEDLSVFGQIFFRDSNSEFFDSAQGIYYSEDVSAKTIFVDPKAFFLRNLGSVNNTIIHECVHWELHRLAFELERLYNDELTAISCKVIGGIEESDVDSANWMEWQANALTPRIQMPLAMFKTKAFELIKHYREKLNTAETIDVLEIVVDELATHFVVSREAAKIRLIDVGYEEAIGVYNYINGKYVPPYKVKEGILNRNQTFSVDYKSLVIESLHNPNLKELIDNGTYLYVDSHLCLNSPKYIEYDIFGKPRLTRYAKLNMEECCIIFTLTLDFKNRYGKQYYTECVLFKNAEGLSFRVAFDGDENISSQEKAALIIQYNKEVNDILKRLPNHFPEALKALMKWKDLKNEELAEKCLLSSKTIQRMRNEEGYEPKLRTVIALCVGMQLPPILSRKLIEISGYAIRFAVEEHAMFEAIITGYYKTSIHECNELLESAGFKILTSDE
ncbi:ImmA/IrrE family metallo-endopeptidase [Bacillus xiamenensis]|uniref:ImmA/IrrE family metallo-endopeptidase n=1 Tax=Bacillus xiamenensis TaxID=1178537 RepID=UPI00028EBE21|nr:ImmA/IrrE family metallo-endopeptidase [Bacillus xiamenensis]EKF35835.1 hypothetical protein BA1_08591 [Bacillus xiamenensis]MCW1836638.1 ImmA/IrrE family metallo-endopeptidase [Bacillus xiamenensis]